MAEHTPGPWKCVDKDGWSGIETPNGEDLLLYAVCDAGWHGRVTFDNPADALLIAAAPELLAACREALDSLHAIGCNENDAHEGALVAKLFDAIEKATGATP